MFFTFNDLSAQKNNINSEIIAKQEIERFVKFCKHLSSISAIDEIIFPETLFSILIFDNYSLSQWLIDASVPMTKRQYMKRFFDKYRRFYSQKDIDGEFYVTLGEQEYNAIGCTFALEHDQILLSLPTYEIWENESVQGKYIALDEFGETETSTRCIENICASMAEDQIVKFQRKKSISDISSGQDLWEKREMLYPNLIFCENVKTQLFEDSEKYHITAVMKKLDRFQEYFSNCNGKYNPNDLGMGARTESETVQKDPKLMKLRRFRLPDGKEELFFDHIGFTGKYKGARIHFLPDAKNRKCYIGYIGKHLPTKKF